MNNKVKNNSKVNLLINIIMSLLLICCVGISVFAYDKADSYHNDVVNARSAVEKTQEYYDLYAKEKDNPIYAAYAANVKVELDQNKENLQKFSKKHTKYIVIGILLDSAAFIGLCVIFIRIKIRKRV